MKEDFIYYTDLKMKLPFVIELAGTSYCDRSYKIHRQKAGCLVMEYVIAGEGTILLDGKKYHAKEGDIYMLPPGCEHLYYSDAENPWTKIWFNAHGTLTTVLPALYNPKNMVVFSNAEGKDHFTRIHEIGQNSSLCTQEKHEKAALVFHELLQCLHAQFYVTRENYSDVTATVKEYIDNHITQNISLKTLGELVYLSESQVIRIFKQDLGMTPYEYIPELNINQAKLLLKNSRLMVKQISGQLGFCDEHYFSFLFRQKTGQTPTAYRKSR